MKRKSYLRNRRLESRKRQWIHTKELSLSKRIICKRLLNELIKRMGQCRKKLRRQYLKKKRKRLRSLQAIQSQLFEGILKSYEKALVTLIKIGKTLHLFSRKNSSSPNMFEEEVAFAVTVEEQTFSTYPDTLWSFNPRSIRSLIKIAFHPHQ